MYVYIYVCIYIDTDLDSRYKTLEPWGLLKARRAEKPHLRVLIARIPPFSHHVRPLKATSAFPLSTVVGLEDQWVLAQVTQSKHQSTGRPKLSSG